MEITRTHTHYFDPLLGIEPVTYIGPIDIEADALATTIYWQGMAGHEMRADAVVYLNTATVNGEVIYFMSILNGDEEPQVDIFRTGEPKQEVRCADCHARKYNYEPDMGDDFAVWETGACDRCETEGIVWKVAL